MKYEDEVMPRVLLFVILSWCTLAFAGSPVSDEAFSKSFRCPEELPSDQARQESLKAFLTWAQQRYPELTIQKVVELRTKFLEEHRCQKTLANIQASSNAASNRPLRSLCTADDGHSYFSQATSSHCTPVPLERGWVNLHSEPAVLLDILPSSVVKERDGTKIWVQFFLAEPAASDDGHWSYDYVKNITKFFCGRKQQLLIQGTYFLKGNRVYERDSRESLLEEIEPGTLAEGMYQYACKK